MNNEIQDIIREAEENCRVWFPNEEKNHEHYIIGMLAQQIYQLKEKNND